MIDDYEAPDYAAYEGYEPDFDALDEEASWHRRNQAERYVDETYKGLAYEDREKLIERAEDALDGCVHWAYGVSPDAERKLAAALPAKLPASLRCRWPRPRAREPHRSGASRRVARVASGSDPPGDEPDPPGEPHRVGAGSEEVAA